MKVNLRLLMPLVAVLLLVGIVSACSSGAAPTAVPPTAAPTVAPATVAPTTAPVATETGSQEAEEVARPSNGGGPGPAIDMTGDVTAGEKVFVDNCQKCHGEKGAEGVDNPGSDDGTVPPLNPIDETMVSSDPKVFATNIDLFVEHGSKPEGDNPKEVMAAWGDDGTLTPQQIADVIAYVMSLNTQ